MTRRELTLALRRAIRLSCRPACDDHIANHARFVERVRACVEDGMVAVVYGGMDCDCSRWDDRVVLLPAVPVVVDKWICDYHDGAEGPQWTRISRPSRAPKKSTSRDLALEAFENGHPHVVYL